MRFFHKEYDFLDLVRRAIAGTADQFAERRITLLEEMPRGPLAAYGDSDRLGRAMGLRSWVVDRPGQMQGVLREALVADVAAVIEVRVAPEIAPPLGARAQTIAGFRDR